MAIGVLFHLSHPRHLKCNSIGGLIGVVFKLLYLCRYICTGVPLNEVKHPPVIVISFDGFRYDYFKRTNTTNMDYLVDSGGVRAPYMRNQFITKTFPNHQSIVTGLYTESHGIVDSHYFDPELNRTLSVKDGDLFWKFDDRVVPLWTVNEWAGHHSGVMMWPSSEVKYGPNGTLPSKYVTWNESYSFEWRVDTAINWLTDEENPVNLLFMYFEEPDELAHAYGPNDPIVTSQISRVDNITGYLIQRLKGVGLFDKTNMIILSDHGFYEVEQLNIINITTIVDPSLYQIVGSSPVIQLRVHDETKIDEVYNKFKNASLENKHFVVYMKSDLPIRFHLGGRRIMPIILIADLGYVFSDFYEDIKWYNQRYNFTPSSTRKFGVHGYDSRYNPMHAIFLARGPAFSKASQESVEPFDNIDVFPLICYLLGIDTPPNNGSLANVEKLIMLKHSSFDFRSPLLFYVIGAAIILGLVILLPILSMIILNRRNSDSSTIIDDNSYRVKFNKDNFHEILEDEDVEIKNFASENCNGLDKHDPDDDDSPQNEENQALLSWNQNLA